MMTLKTFEEGSPYSSFGERRQIKTDMINKMALITRNVKIKTHSSCWLMMIPPFDYFFSNYFFLNLEMIFLVKKYKPKTTRTIPRIAMTYKNQRSPSSDSIKILLSDYYIYIKHFIPKCESAPDCNILN